MSGFGPFGSAGTGGPFGDLMRDLARLLTSQGPVNWEVAKQLAQWTAGGGQPEVNPDPLSRVRLEELLRVAELHVTEATGLSAPGGGMLTVRAVTPGEWAGRTLDAWRSPLERLAGAMTAPPGSGPGRPGQPPGGLEDQVTGLGSLFGRGQAEPGPGWPPDPMGQLFGNLPQVLGPLLFGMQTGSMVGELAARAMGQYDLPAPRPASDEIMMVPATIDRFAADWSLGPDDVRLWICLREAATHVVMSRPHVRARLEELMGAYVGAFSPDPQALEDRLTGLDPTDMGTLQSLFGDPEALFGELRSDAQRRLQVPLQALLAVVVGYVDRVLDTVGRRLIGSYGPLAEALRRQRLDETSGTRVLGQLLGIELDAATYERGQSFCRGVLERAGEEGLARLWQAADYLPTPAEIEAPGLWLARIDLPRER